MYGHYLANFMSLVILQYMISNILMIMQIDDMSDGLYSMEIAQVLNSISCWMERYRTV